MEIQGKGQMIVLGLPACDEHLDCPMNHLQPQKWT